MGIEFVSRYTGLADIPKPWRACAPCQGLGIDLAASTATTDAPCLDCRGSRRRPLYRSLLDLPRRIGKALRFGWRYAVRGEGGWGRRIALRAMLADFV